MAMHVNKDSQIFLENWIVRQILLFFLAPGKTAPANLKAACAFKLTCLRLLGCVRELIPETSPFVRTLLETAAFKAAEAAERRREWARMSREDHRANPGSQRLLF